MCNGPVPSGAEHFGLNQPVGHAATPMQSDDEHAQGCGVPCSPERRAIAEINATHRAMRLVVSLIDRFA